MARRMFEKKIVWITGASSGIGRALATAFALEGASLILSARNISALEETAAGILRATTLVGEHGSAIHILPLDIENLDALPAAAGEAEKFFGRVDVLINNAGLSQRSLFMEMEPAVIEKLLKINLLSQIRLTGAVLPGMTRRGGGLIAGVTSIVGKFGSPMRTVYSAAKHGLHGFYDSLRAEVRGKSVHVVTVVPGFVRTDISKHALTGEGVARNIMDQNQEKGVSPELCARQIVLGLKRGKEEIYCGMNGKARASLFLRKWLPGTFRKIIAKVKVT